MKHPLVLMIIQQAAGALEVVGVSIVALAFAYALARATAHLGRRRADAYEQLRSYLGRSLLLGLEFLVAADIIRTVLIEPTMGGILSLGLLVVVRIILGWSIAVEIEGCWPWQVAERRKAGSGDRRGT